MLEGMCSDPMGLQCSAPSVYHPDYAYGHQQFLNTPRSALGPVLQQMGILPMSYSTSMQRHGSHSLQKASSLTALNDFLERAYELQDRAHRLWQAEQAELQRGIDLNIISTSMAADCSPRKVCASPITARAVDIGDVATPASLLMTPPSAGLLMAATSPLLSDRCLLSPTAVLGSHLDMQHTQGRMGAAQTVSPAMPCSTAGASAATATTTINTRVSKGPAMTHHVPHSACGTLKYAPASVAPGTVVGPSRKTSREERELRQLQLQQQLDGSVSHMAPGTAGSAGAGAGGSLFFSDQLSPMSPVHLLMAGNTSGLHNTSLDSGLIEMYGMGGHADLQLGQEPHLNVGPINTKKPRH